MSSPSDPPSPPQQDDVDASVSSQLHQSEVNKPTVNVIASMDRQKRYEMPVELQKLGYTDCRSFAQGKIALYFAGKPILADLLREDWGEKFERRAKPVVKAKIRDNNALAQQVVQEGLCFLALIYIQRQQQEQPEFSKSASGTSDGAFVSGNNNVDGSNNPAGIDFDGQQHYTSTNDSAEEFEEDSLITRLESLDRPISVKQAIRRHAGRAVTLGIVTSTSNIYKLIRKAKWRCLTCDRFVRKDVRKLLDPPPKPKQCPYCESKEGFEDAHSYLNAVTLRMQDDDLAGDDMDSENDLNALPVVIFEQDTWHNPVGENVRVIGDVEQVHDKKAKSYNTYLIAKAIQQQQRKKRTLTHEDMHAIKRFAGMEPIWKEKGCLIRSNLKSRLISMFAPNIICDDNKKLVQLLAAVGAPEDEYHRGRINELMIGPPGTGKTKLAKETMKLRINSRYVSSKNTTGLSLTAMILKENENYVVHLGPVPLSKHAICVVNELDKLEPERQDNLLDVMEEGVITLNKFARLKSIRSPTTIIATANPHNNRWINSEAITADEIPIELTKLSRFDIVLIFKNSKDIQENRKFANAKTSYDRKGIKHNYNFLVAYIEYARTINPVITPEAQSMLNEYWARLSATEGLFVTTRLLEALGRLAKAFARLYLQKVADVDIAKEVIDLVNSTMMKFLAAMNNVADPRAVAYDETINIIHQQQGKPIDLIEAVKIACQKNAQLRYYLGNEIDQSRNKKVRDLCNKIIESRSALRVKIRPLVVRWRIEHDDGSRQDNNDSAATVRHDDDNMGGGAGSAYAAGGKASAKFKPQDIESHESQRSQTTDNQPSNALECDQSDLCDSQAGADSDDSKSSYNSEGPTLQIPKDIQRNLSDCVAFDSEWEPDSHVITAAAFVDTQGCLKILQLSDFGGSEKDLVLAYVHELTRHQASVGWGTIGHVAAFAGSIGDKMHPSHIIEGGLVDAA